MLSSLCLNGVWQLGYSDGERGRPEYALAPTLDPKRYFTAEVPGCVHLDLMRAGLLEDPVLGLNSLRARWVEECIWAYRRDFEVPAAALGVSAWLVFEQLDLNARIYLNGTLIGTHHNAFLPCRLDVRAHLRAGQNQLAVLIESGVIGAGDKPSTSLGNQNHYAYSRALHKSHWLRKPAFQFGWDWAARVGNVGLSGAVRLEYTFTPLRLDRVVPLITVAEDLASAQLRVRAFAENLTADASPITLTIRIPELGLEARATGTLVPGEGCIELTTTARNFALWWPRGAGEARLYDLTVTLEDATGTRHTAPPQRIGFRHTRLDQSPHPQGGNYCVLHVNHRPVFLKGANWVPADLLLARINDTTYDALIARALEANFNFIRVWGGGLYESDHFYALCDQAGLIVWQDFAYACAKYPLQDEALFLSAKAEARHQIRRLAAHPSLVVWCGNNEMECGNWHWGYDRGIIFPDYAFFHHVLPRLLQEEDPTRCYRASSPLSPDGQSPARDDMGDQHNWKVSLEHGDYRAWRDMACRMMTEAGYLGPASLPTLRACLPPAPASPEAVRFAWTHHDNSVDSWHNPSLPDTSFREHTGYDLRALALEDYAYLGGLLHGEALGVFVDNFRWRQFDSSAACFWMFNDCWPTTRSWTIVDYQHRRTPAFWAVKRAFAPLRLILAPQPEGIRVYGVNESTTPVVGTLDYGLFSTRSAPTAPAHRVAVTLAPNASTLLATLPTLAATEAHALVPYALLRDTTGTLLTRQRLLLPRLGELTLAPPSAPRIEVANGYARFTSEHFVLGVCLDLDGDQPLADNFFDLYPGQPHEIAWPYPAPPRILHTANAWFPAPAPARLT